jgi:hypothetical protein
LKAIHKKLNSILMPPCHTDLAYKSVWFQYLTEHTEGKVIEILQDGLPSLVVEYHVGDTLTIPRMHGWTCFYNCGLGPF